MKSAYFTIDEFRCHSGESYPEEWANDRLQSLCDVLDAIRSAWGGPLHVVCGYRTHEYNARLAAKSSGVAQNSQHVQGRAADVRPRDPTPMNVKRLHDLVKGMHSRGELPKMGGLGVYPGWIHVDVRAHQPRALAEWTGKGVGSEQ